MVSIEALRKRARALWERVCAIPLPFFVRVWLAEERHGHTLHSERAGWRCQLCGGRWPYKPIALFEPCPHWW